MTDTIPLFGYRRKSYLMLFGVLGFLMWNVMATYGIHNPDIGVGLLLGINICIAFCNVIGEALLVELSGHTQDAEAENVELDPEKKAQSGASAS
jgi:BT1 family